MQRSYTLANQSLLKPTLDRLYADFNFPDSATDPIQIVRRFVRPDDREVVAFCAASLAFGRVASVLQSIERLMAIMGDHPADYVRRFDPRRDAAAFDGLVHRWTRERDLIALVWVIKQMLDRSGTIEGFFLEGYDAEARRHRDRARQLFGAGDGPRSLRRLRTRAETGRRLLLLSEPVQGQRVQAAQPVPAVDGATATRSISASGRAWRLRNWWCRSTRT